MRAMSLLTTELFKMIDVQFVVTYDSSYRKLVQCGKLALDKGVGQSRLRSSGDSKFRR